MIFVIIAAIIMIAGGIYMLSQKRIFTLRLSGSDHAKMKAIAAQDFLSMANYIEMLVKREISSYELVHGIIQIAEEE